MFSLFSPVMPGHAGRLPAGIEKQMALSNAAEESTDHETAEPNEKEFIKS